MLSLRYPHNSNCGNMVMCSAHVPPATLTQLLPGLDRRQDDNGMPRRSLRNANTDASMVDNTRALCSLHFRGNACLARSSMRALLGQPAIVCLLALHLAVESGVPS